MKEKTLESLITAGLVAAVVLGGVWIENKYNHKQNEETDTPPIVLSGTPDVKPGVLSGNGDDVEVEIQDIDIVSAILKTGKPVTDFSVITFPVQNIHPETAKQDLENYLKNNVKSILMPEDINDGYLYIRLHKPLKMISQLNVLQPVTLKTNIYISNWGVYGRLDTSKTLPVFESNKEFLFKLSDVPVNTSKHDSANRLVKKGQRLNIAGYVSDTNGNYIESVSFVWIRN